MSLARMLLTESAGVYGPAGDEYKVCVEDGTQSMFMDAAVESLMTDIYNVDKAYMVADVIAETKVITEGASPEVLLENIITSGFQKLKEAFQKFWKKIKSWFAEIRRQFDIIFKTGKDFIDKFRKELMDRSDKGFKYTGYDYDPTAGAKKASDAFGIVDAKLKEYLGAELAKNTTNHSMLNAEDIVGKTYASTFTDKSGGTDRKSEDLDSEGLIKDFATPEAREAIIEKVMSDMGNGADSTSEVTKYLTEQFRGGAEEGETEEIEEFGGNMNRDNMIDYIYKFKDSLKAVTDKEKAFDKHLSSIIKKLDGYKSKAGDDDSEKIYKNCKNMSAMLTKLLNLGKIPTQVEQSMMKEINSHCHKVLKSLLNHKPAKESVEISNGSYENLLEAAMRMI